MPTLNDLHSGLNRTPVKEVCLPRDSGEVAMLIRRAREHGEVVSVAGGRHAMGGQQFATGSVHVDTRAMSRVLSLDPVRGLVEAEAGITWPALMDALEAMQPEHAGAPSSELWTIRQKQTGADRMTLGGSVSANIHGRTLGLPPLVADVESAALVDAEGIEREVSRTSDPRLFSLVVGGYGLFGIITRVRLRLARRLTLRREVCLLDAPDLPAAFAERVRAGYHLGDWQFAIDPAGDEFLRRGVFSCYRPVPAQPIPPGQRSLAPADWLRLLELAHRDKARGFAEYARHYLATNGQLYHSDRCQLATYIDGYHRLLSAPCRAGSEIITELYVGPEDLPAFMADAAAVLRREEADVIYGTVRLAAQDTETFLPWARRDVAGVIFNLHTARTRAAVARSARVFRGLIDAAIAYGGSFYLTYHRFATRRQLLACHPDLPRFLEAKRACDPSGIFQSKWFRHHLGVLASARTTGERHGRDRRRGRAAALRRPAHAGVRGRGRAGR
jgi:FAD/FMN-containing dehydrogenase